MSFFFLPFLFFSSDVHVQSYCVHANSKLTLLLDQQDHDGHQV